MTVPCLGIKTHQPAVSFFIGFVAGKQLPIALDTPMILATSLQNLGEPQEEFLMLHTQLFASRRRPIFVTIFGQQFTDV